MEHEGTIDGIIAGMGGITLQLRLGTITPDEMAELYRIKGLPVSVRVRRVEHGPDTDDDE